jgi:hypothetical protein
MLRRVKAQVQDRVEKAKESGITAAAESLAARLSAVEGELYQVNLRGVLDGGTFPYKLNQHLANLKLSVETGDGRPTPQAYAAFERLSSELNALLRRLDEVLEKDLVQFNRLLAERKLAPVDATR